MNSWVTPEEYPMTLYLVYQGEAIELTGVFGYAYNGKLAAITTKDGISFVTNFLKRKDIDYLGPDKNFAEFISLKNRRSI